MLRVRDGEVLPGLAASPLLTSSPLVWTGIQLCIPLAPSNPSEHNSGALLVVSVYELRRGLDLGWQVDHKPG